MSGDPAVPVAPVVPAETDVVVVGGGLAGLTCALEVQRAGLDVVVLEAADGVGGRVRTDRVDGFLLDRGFQLLNPAYPALHGLVDVPALALQSFRAGVVARTEGRRVALGHPLRERGLLLASAGVALREPRSLAGLARWLVQARPGSGRLADRLADRDRRSLASALDDRDVDGLLRRVLDAFLAGVLLDDTGVSADAFALLLVRTFALGTPGLPRDGMTALPRQLASRLTRPVAVNRRVESIGSTGSGVRVRTAAGDVVSARQVVVATQAPAVAHLLDDLGVGPSGNGVVTQWWVAPDDSTEPRRRALLHVDARRPAGGPLVNAAVISQAAPSYAPVGRHLVQGSALMGGPTGRSAPDEPTMRAHAGDLLGLDTRDWRALARHEIPYALPAQRAPLVVRRPVRVSSTTVVCGDHRDTASIQGALVSGRRAGREVVAATA